VIFFHCQYILRLTSHYYSLWFLSATCQIPATSCLGVCGLVYLPTGEEEAHCKAEKKCNWMAGDCKGSCSTSSAFLFPSSYCITSIDSNCDQCNTSEYFCAYCTSDAHCVEITGPTNEAECEQTEACVLPNGEIELLSKVLPWHTTSATYCSSYKYRTNASRE